MQSLVLAPVGMGSAQLKGLWGYLVTQAHGLL